MMTLILDFIEDNMHVKAIYVSADKPEHLGICVLFSQGR